MASSMRLARALLVVLIGSAASERERMHLMAARDLSGMGAAGKELSAGAAGQGAMLADQLHEANATEESLAEQAKRLQEENWRLKQLLGERQHLLEEMVPAPVVADLLQRQQQWHSAGEDWSWHPEDEASASKARFLSHERAQDAPHVGLAKAVSHDSLTIFFSDLVGFTDMSQSVLALEVMTFLNELYSRFDDILSGKYRTLWKVETIGDSYMVAGGLMEVPGMPLTPADSAREVVAFAREALEVASSMKMPNGRPVKLRVGVHSGPASTGVVGSRMPRYCLFGETVNLASRMESTGLPGAIQVSERTWSLLGERVADPQGEPDAMAWRARGAVHVKGKGDMNTYVLDRPADRPAE